MRNLEIPTTEMNDLPPGEVYFGQTLGMLKIRQRVEKIANADVPLLIEGGNGTGKEVLARLVHAKSFWGKGRFVKVNCAAIPGSLMESELFGYERGAFTGANTAKPGRVELADGGTLFLDEIGELNLSLQAKLLQFLQDGHFSRIGGEEEKRVHTRVVCATSRRLEREVKAGAFRMDLFYRINVIHIKLPFLRERSVDIPRLAKHFLAVYGARFRQAPPVLSPDVMYILQTAEWPGNVRELENCMARCVILGPEAALEAYARRGEPKKPPSGNADQDAKTLKFIARAAQRNLEREVILKTLESHNWNRRKTAVALKISYRALLYKVREAGIPSLRQSREANLS